MNLVKLLERYYACCESKVWAQGREANKEAWDACHRADWMLWFAAECGVDPKLVIAAACKCAWYGLDRIQNLQAKNMVVEVERWCTWRATIEDVMRVRHTIANEIGDQKLECCSSEMVSAGYTLARIVESIETPDADDGDYCECNVGDEIVDVIYYVMDACIAEATIDEYHGSAYLGVMALEWVLADAVRNCIPWKTIEATLKGIES